MADLVVNFLGQNVQEKSCSRCERPLERAIWWPGRELVVLSSPALPGLWEVIWIPVVGGVMEKTFWICSRAASSGKRKNKQN